MTRRLSTWGIVAITMTLVGAHSAASRQAAPPRASQTQVVLLGTGTPPADPDRSGPATAIVVDGTPYLVDFGAGVVRRAKSAVVDRGIAALDPVKLRVVFMTHLHSDHTVGYPDLILTPWVLGRRVPLEVYGPSGIKAHDGAHHRSVSRGLRGARPRSQRCTPSVRSRKGTRSTRTRSSAGIVYKDANVTVTAFATKHTMESYGYRFDTPDRSIVISGDTNPTQATIDACRGCDVLIHEVLTHDWLSRRPDFHAYAAQASHDDHAARRAGEARRSRVCWFSITRRCRCVPRWTPSVRRRPCCCARCRSYAGTRRRRPRPGRVLSADGEPPTASSSSQLGLS